MARIAAFAAVLLFAMTQAASANYRWLVDEAYAGNAEGVLRQLEAGLDPNPPTGHEGRSALLAAATEGHAEIVEILLRRGADTEWRAADGERALVAATRTAYLGGRAETVRLLLDAGSPISSPDDPFGLTPLMQASVATSRWWRCCWSVAPTCAPPPTMATRHCTERSRTPMVPRSHAC
jgi:ankyrin repeat protein